MKRRIAIVTTSRSDYGPLYWLVHDLFRDARFEPLLLVGGAHVSERHGMTVREIEEDGFPIAARLPASGEDSAASHAEACARLQAETVRRLTELAPDLVLVHGDRFELLAVGAAAVLTRTPIAHVGGGDVTEGALDEQVRHALTKLAHLHFAGTENSARRLRQMGEEPWRVTVTGDPAIDRFVRDGHAPAQELKDVLGFVPGKETLAVSFHPATLESADVARHAAELVEALANYSGQLVLTGPAPDPGNDAIRSQLQALGERHPRARYVESLGSRRYRGLLHAAGALVGNSSSGIIEAGAIPLPVVNIGDRQKGRERGAHVLDCAIEARAIRVTLAKALSPDFARALRDARNPYGDGHASERIIAALAAAPDRSALLRKKFVFGGSPAGS